MNAEIKNEASHVLEQLPDDTDLELVIQALRLNIARGVKNFDEVRTVIPKQTPERFA